MGNLSHSERTLVQKGIAEEKDVYKRTEVL